MQIGGALTSPEDPNDYIYEHIASSSQKYIKKFPEEYYINEQIKNDLYFQTEFPEEHIINSKLSRDQGTRPTCAAFAGATIKEMQQDNLHNLSPEFIYYHRENKPLPGMYGRDVMQILKKIGTVKEETYPYNYQKTPTPYLYEQARKHSISTYARIQTIDGLKRALLELGPAYLQLPMYTNEVNFWKQNLPNQKSNNQHAVAVVGYNKIGFILKNSWGPVWNTNGCVTFPYEDWDTHQECWISVEEPPHQESQITKKHKYNNNNDCIIF